VAKHRIRYDNLSVNSVHIYGDPASWKLTDVRKRYIGLAGMHHQSHVAVIMIDYRFIDECRRSGSVCAVSLSCNLTVMAGAAVALPTRFAISLTDRARYLLCQRIDEPRTNYMATITVVAKDHALKSIRTLYDNSLNEARNRTRVHLLRLQRPDRRQRENPSV